ncbi:MAG: hypothetical protein MR433_02840, partial [Coriobacteriaceae bacterium]|nr:hypothetical protein [Coriobacteriaceae bacterium]
LGGPGPRGPTDARPPLPVGDPLGGRPVVQAEVAGALPYGLAALRREVGGVLAALPGVLLAGCVVRRHVGLLL